MTSTARRVIIPAWFDVFTFDSAPVIICPDCDMHSPELRDIWEAARWADTHEIECEA